MRNKGLLSRTMIVEHVWDMDYDGLTNIVDVTSATYAARSTTATRRSSYRPCAASGT
jgi:DNA-binding response OmpR family regulator